MNELQSCICFHIGFHKIPSGGYVRCSGTWSWWLLAEMNVISMSLFLLHRFSSIAPAARPLPDCAPHLIPRSHRDSLLDRSSTLPLHCPRCSRWGSLYSRSSQHSISYPPPAPPVLIKVSRAETCSRSIPTHVRLEWRSRHCPLIPTSADQKVRGLLAPQSTY